MERSGDLAPLQVWSGDLRYARTCTAENVMFLTENLQKDAAPAGRSPSGGKPKSLPASSALEADFSYAFAGLLGAEALFTYAYTSVSWISLATVQPATLFGYARNTLAQAQITISLHNICRL